MGSRSRRLLNQSTHSSVANSTACNDRHGPRPMDDLGLVETVDRLGESIVITVADAAHRRLDARLYHPLGIYLIETYWADSTGHRNILRRRLR
jgi:hypothetical protein